MKKLLALTLAMFIMVFTLAACGDDNNGEGSGSTDLPKGYDKEFTIYVDGSDEWTPFEGKSGVSFTVSDDKVISVSDDGTKIEFTGKQIGESTITAAVEGTESKALVRVRSMENTDKHYLSYYEPVKVYYYEYTSSDSVNIRGYDNQNYLEGCVDEYYQYVTSSGNQYVPLDGGWILHPDEPKWDDWNTDYKGYEWPLAEFANLIANRDEELDIRISNASMAEISETRPEDLPKNRDVTKYYLRSETICEIQCDVYQVNADYVVYTFWVDPDAGLTLKYEEVENGKTRDSFEVTKLLIGDANFGSFEIDKSLTRFYF